jgi:hypothetical protein
MNGESTTSWRRRAFCRGVRQRSPLVLLAAAALCVPALLGVQQFFFGGGLTVIGQDRLVRHEHDDQLHVAYTVNRLKQDPPAVPVVYLFGGSGAMESVTGDRAFAAQIRRRSGQDVRVVGLANHAQSLAQNLVIVDNLPRGDATVAIGLAPMRFNTSPTEDMGLLASRTLLLRSSRLRELAPELYDRRASWTGGLPGVWDFVSGYLRERIASGKLPGRRLHYLRHYYGQGTTAVSAERKRQGLPSVYEYNTTHYAANHAYNLTVLRELVALARSKGFRVVFFEQPLNTSIAGDWAGVLPRYRAEVGQIAAEYGVPYLRVQESLRLVDQDFVDLYHLMPQARVRWQARMAREVASILSPSSASVGARGATPAE